MTDAYPGKTAMQESRDERRAWLVRHILPHEPALRRQLRRWGLPGNLDVDDVVQEAYAKLSSLDIVSNIGNPRNYLYQVAKSIIYLHVRRSKIVSIHLKSDLEGMAGDGDLPGPEIEVSDRQQLQSLFQSITELDEPMRSVIYYRAIEDLQFQAIGERLSVSANAAQKIFAKALKRLACDIGWGDAPQTGPVDRRPAGKTTSENAARK